MRRAGGLFLFAFGLLVYIIMLLAFGVWCVHLELGAYLARTISSLS